MIILWATKRAQMHSCAPLSVVDVRIRLRLLLFRSENQVAHPSPDFRNSGSFQAGGSAVHSAGLGGFVRVLLPAGAEAQTSTTRGATEPPSGAASRLPEFLIRRDVRISLRFCIPAELPADIAWDGNLLTPASALTTGVASTWQTSPDERHCSCPAGSPYASINLTSSSSCRPSGHPGCLQ